MNPDKKYWHDYIGYNYRLTNMQAAIGVAQMHKIDNIISRKKEIAAEYNGKMKICKLDIDANENTPPKYGIRGIPTLMLFKNGAVEATKVGALSKSQLTAFLDSNI